MRPTHGFAWFIFALKRYAEFNGRSSRKEFWYFMLFAVISNIIFETIGNLIGGVGGNIFALVYYVAVLIPNIAVQIRRMHDTNRRGWWCLVPIGNIIFACQASDPRENRFGPSPLSDAAFSGYSGGISMVALEQLEKLASLREKGILTNEEFQMKKAAIL
jgi:uncharacterized membrane protein YhaH (DUF805 family)